MATTYNDTQIAIVDSSGNISVIYPRTKASLVSLTASSYTNVEDCLAALTHYEYSTCARNTSNTTNSNVHYQIYGRMCIITGWVIPSTNGQQSGKELLTGVPAPGMNVNVFMYDQDNGNTVYGEIQDSKTVLKTNKANSSSGHYVNIQVAYILKA